MKKPNSNLILFNAFIHSHMDYGNSLQYGISNKLINRLQKLQNAAARLVTNGRKDISNRKLLQTLHWLPIRSRIQFKILTLVYRCLHDQAPTYLSDLLSIKDPSTYSLRSNHRFLLQVPKMKCKTLGDRWISCSRTNSVEPSSRINKKTVVH